MSFLKKSSVSASHSKSIRTLRDRSGRGCSESVHKGLEVRNAETKHWGGVKKLDMLSTVVWGIQASFICGRQVESHEQFLTGEKWHDQISTLEGKETREAVRRKRGLELETEYIMECGVGLEIPGWNSQ